MDKLSIFIIIALVLIIAGLIVKQNKDKLLSFLPSKKNKDDNDISDCLPETAPQPRHKESFPELKKIINGLKENESSSSGKTELFGRGIIQQLDSSNGNVLHSYNIDYSDDPICININRKGVKRLYNQITVEESPYTRAFSSNAYYIYTSPSGAPALSYRKDIVRLPDRLKDGDRTINPIFYYDFNEGKAKEFPKDYSTMELFDGTLFCLGRQWFRFVEPQNPDIDPFIFDSIEDDFSSEEAFEPPVIENTSGTKVFTPDAKVFTPGKAAFVRSNNTIRFKKDDNVNKF